MTYKLVKADACNDFAPISTFVLGAAVQPPVKFTPICVAQLDGVHIGDLIDVSGQCVLSARPETDGSYEGFTQAELFSSAAVFVTTDDWSVSNLVDPSQVDNATWLDKQDATDAWYSISNITQSYPMHVKTCKWIADQRGTLYVAMLSWAASGAATQGNERLKVVTSECYLHVAQHRAPLLP